MNPKQLIKVARRWGWLSAIPVIVVGLYLAITYHPPGNSYRVDMHFTVGGIPADPLSPDYDRYYAWLVSEYVANGLADLARTSSFAHRVADRLGESGAGIAPEAIQGALVTDNAQSVMVATLTWHNPDQAILLAEAISAELLEAAPHYYPQMQGTGTVARLADDLRAVYQAPGLRSQLLGPALRMALAFALGVGLALAAHYFDPWVREATEVTHLGLDIVGAIPPAPRRRRAE